MTKILFREKEIQLLDDIRASKSAEFIAIYGRRRIGKTYLISQYFQDKGTYFELTGVYDASLKEQLYNFMVTYNDIFFDTPLSSPPTTWQEAFLLLRKKIETLPKTKKIILFFDELPWLASKRSKFLPALEHLWNRYLSRMPNIILIICGSAAAWMIDNIINNKKGLHNRLTRHIRLLPFTLNETIKFLKAKQIQLAEKDYIELYMILGGVAKYLNLVKPGISVAQIVNELCFSRNGYLFQEFNRLYRSLFDAYEQHVEIIKALSQHHYGLTRAQLITHTGFSSGGGMTRLLRELEESGFIIKVANYGQRKTKVTYRLADEYSHFYLRWIANLTPTKLESIDPDHWLKQHNTQRWNNWAGYAFENLCFKHNQAIKAALGIAGISSSISSWQHTTKESDKNGAQIDLIIDRADNCINLCEIKFLTGEFTIKKDYAKNLETKKQIFLEQTKTKKSLFTTLITSYGCKQNPYFLSTVQKSLQLTDFIKF